MIEIANVTKKFDDFTAVDDISLTMKKGLVYGLLGTNGAGKSTLLRMISGVSNPDAGTIRIDDLNIDDNPEAKSRLFFISDDYYYFTHGNAEDTAKYLALNYDHFSFDKYHTLMDSFGLDPKRKVSTYSKGMKKQLSIILGLAANTDYLLCDETFDGLDPAMRQAVKTLMAKEITDRELTVIIASHNLRELEDICDTIGLLHKGHVLLSEDLDAVKCNIHKCQVVFKTTEIKEQTLRELDIVTEDQRGQLTTFTARGDAESIQAALANADTVFFEILPLSLEEIFISETEVVGYDIKKLLLEA